MSAPFYGNRTVMRPLFRNVPDMPGGLLSKCPYCGHRCWITPAEQSNPTLPAGMTFTSACTGCALNRNVVQRSMDRARWEKENAEVAELAASASGVDGSGG